MNKFITFLVYLSRKMVNDFKTYISKRDKTFVRILFTVFKFS